MDGRARWKVENENNNVLKTKGYHIEHNFGHGNQHLASLLLHRHQAKRGRKCVSLENTPENVILWGVF